MRNTNETVRWAACALSLVLAGSSAALAQTDPEAGDEAPSSQDQGRGRGRGRARFGGAVQAGTQAEATAETQSEGTWQPPTGQIPANEPAADVGTPIDEAPVEEPAQLGDSDHAGVVGSLGIGFFGVMALPVMGCDLTVALCAAIGNSTLAAPAIGARYWLNEQFGVEAALGLNISSGTIGPLETSALGVALHGGVPIALAHSGHFVFEVVPQLNFGIASGSYEIPGVAPAPGTTADASGMLFEIGAKAGAEIHFGFIDIPQLSLQGSVGLMVRSESRSVDTQAGATPAVTADQSQLTIGTGVDGEPWDIFTGSITAIYYL